MNPLRLLVNCCATALLVASCSKSPVPPVVATPRVTTPAPVALATPIASVARATPLPEHRRLAPEGTFYLVQRVSVTTKTGVIGFAPGTVVRAVSENERKFTVTDGTLTFDVPKDQLTNDPNLAAIAARNDAVSQQATAEYMRQLNTSLEQQREIAARRAEVAVQQSRVTPNKLAKQRVLLGTYEPSDADGDIQGALEEQRFQIDEMQLEQQLEFDDIQVKLDDIQWRQEHPHDP